MLREIFKAYDVRGLAPEQLNPEIAYGTGRATAHRLAPEGGALVVGRDARKTSPELAEAITAGVRDEGVEVIDIGLVATPMLYYAVDRLGARGGIMITASHNPGQYNGFKICRENAIPVGEDSGLQDIRDAVEARAAAPAASARGGLRQEDIAEGYCAHVLAVGSGRPALKIAIDCANGMAGVALERVLKELPLEVEALYFEPDGTFPNHEADPLKIENLADVSAAVKRAGCDFGVAFDGDADRAVFVDEKGRPISADLLTALLATRQLRRNPGGLILYDLRSSRVVAEEVEAAGGRSAMSRVGHSFIKAHMRESGAIFAGELSGHMYFRFSETLMADDGVAALVALLDVLAEESAPLSTLIDPLRRYAASGEINTKVNDVDAVIEEIRREHAGAPEVSELDGLLVRYPSWWFNLRKSNTEPVLRLNLEADDAAQMERERDRLLARIHELGGP